MPKALRWLTSRILPTHCKFIALMPQWDFLKFRDYSTRYPSYDLRMRTEVTGLIEKSGRVVGVLARSPEGDLEIFADLVVGCDGRSSTLREQAGLEVEDIGAPIDVLWFRMFRRSDDATDMFGHIEAGKMMVMLTVAITGSVLTLFQKVVSRACKSQRSGCVPRCRRRDDTFLRDRIGEIKSWDDVKLLTVLKSTGFVSGTSRACSASGTPHMPCPRLEASASISQSRMWLPPPMSWLFR